MRLWTLRNTLTLKDNTKEEGAMASWRPEGHKCKYSEQDHHRAIYEAGFDAAIEALRLESLRFVDQKGDGDTFVFSREALKEFAQWAFARVFYPEARQ